jgi:hypothetical protein
MPPLARKAGQTVEEVVVADEAATAATSSISIDTGVAAVRLLIKSIRDSCAQCPFLLQRTCCERRASPIFVPLSLAMMR